MERSTWLFKLAYRCHRYYRMFLILAEYVHVEHVVITQTFDDSVTSQLIFMFVITLVILAIYWLIIILVWNLDVVYIYI